MKLSRSSLALIAACGLVACGPTGSPDARSAESEEVVRNFIDAINTRDWDLLETLVAEDIVRHSASTPGITVASRDDFTRFLRADLESVPDAMQEVDIMFASGNMVAVRARYLGTQTGQLGPFPPSGESIDLPFIGLLRIEDGRVQEIWVEWNNLEMLTQIGYFPPPGVEPSPGDAGDDTADPLGLAGTAEDSEQ